jgi:hypothetical protein
LQQTNITYCVAVVPSSAELQAQLTACDCRQCAYLAGLDVHVHVPAAVVLPQVVGYDLASLPPYWLCKNSWSTNFAAGALEMALIRLLPRQTIRTLHHSHGECSTPELQHASVLAAAQGAVQYL